MLSAGQDLVLVIDVQGARQVKARGVDHTAIFVMPPSFEVLEQRLRGRSKDSEDEMQRRLDTARAEVVELRRLRLRGGQRRARTDRRPAAGDHRRRALTDASHEVDRRAHSPDVPIMSLIALGICGGIGAYKAVEVARGLQKQGHDVAAIMTRSARRFVGPLTLEAITRREVITDQWKPGANADIEHISLASSADLLLVAPATANVIGKFANGIADDFLSSLYLATTAPVLMAPAMNTNMFAHPAVVRNLGDADGARGPLRRARRGLSGLRLDRQGTPRRARRDRRGRVSHAARLPGVWPEQRVLVTAGPTFEDIDPVRFIGNRSSGKMGYALAAEAATARGARHAW